MIYTLGPGLKMSTRIIFQQISLFKGHQISSIVNRSVLSENTL